MHKKYFLIIMLSHLVVPISMLFPVLRVNEIRLVPSGSTLADEYYINLFDYIYSGLYIFTGFFILALITLQIIFSVLALVGLVSKKHRPIIIRLLFVSSFLSAVLGALQIYSGSSILFILCAISFALIAFASIKLIKIEEK